MGKPPSGARDSTGQSRKSKSQQLKESKNKAQRSLDSNTFSSLDSLPGDDQMSLPLDSFPFESEDFVSMQWPPSSFASTPDLGYLSDDFGPLIFSPSARTEDDAMSYPVTPQFQDRGQSNPPSALDMNLSEVVTVPNSYSVTTSPGFNTKPSGLSWTREIGTSETQDCASFIASTFIMLHSLRIDSSPCSCPMTNGSCTPISSVEQILITNKAGMECMNRILACPCFRNPHHALALALICYKILGNYEAIINIASTASPPDDPCSSMTGDAKTTAITIGAYQMDAGDERRLRIQLVVNELRKVKGVIDRYEDMYRTPVDGVRDQQELLYSALEEFLRSDLKGKLKKMSDALQD